MLRIELGADLATGFDGFAIRRVRHINESDLVILLSSCAPFQWRRYRASGA